MISIIISARTKPPDNNARVIHPHCVRSMFKPSLRAWSFNSFAPICPPYDISCVRARLVLRHASTKPLPPRKPTQSLGRTPHNKAEGQRRSLQDSQPIRRQRRYVSLRVFGGTIILAFGFVAFTESGRNAYKGVQRTARVTNTLGRCIIEYETCLLILLTSC